MASTEAQQDLDAITAFVVENRDLERLKALLERFNIFEAIGVVRQELRHSDFLAFLLNSQENHRLDDIFVKRLLQRLLMETEDTSLPVTPMDLDLWSLEQMEVRREWQRIDILLLDEPNRLAVIIENKIGTSEHSDQLRRYHQIVTEHHPGWRVIGLYMTPGGDTLSYEAYLPVDYGSICDVLDGIAESRGASASPDLKTLIAHYTEMLRRHIVGDSEIARLCQQIYRKHQRALDLIYEHRPDPQAAIRIMALDLMENTPGLALESRGKQFIRFAIPEWDVPILMAGTGWTSSGRMLLFEFVNWPNEVRLVLTIGPGPTNTRKRLFEMALANQPLFQDVSGGLKTKYNWVFSSPVLTAESYEDVGDEERERKIRKRWVEILETDLPRIDTVLKKEGWIWQRSSNADETI